MDSNLERFVVRFNDSKESIALPRSTVASSVQQSVAYGKFWPDAYIPRDALLKSIYEDQKDLYSYSNRLLSAVCLKGGQYCVSAGGADRRQIRLARLGSGTGRDSYVVTHHNASIEGIFCNMDDGLHDMESRRPVFAVTSAASVDFFRLLDGGEHHIESRTFSLNRLEPRYTSMDHRVEDYSWNQYMSSSGLVITAAGDVQEYDCGQTRQLAVKKLGTYSNNEDQADDAHHLGVIRCECSPVHPSLAMAALHKDLIRVDFRERQPRRTEADIVYSFSEKNFITALGVSSRHISTNQYGFAAATATHVHLFDLRKAIRPIASWEHYVNSPSGQEKSWVDLCSASPDGLNFVSLGGSDALVATSSFLGKGIVLRWDTDKDPPSIVYCNGNFVQNRPGVRPSVDDAFSFIFEPTNVDGVDPIEPPELVYDAASVKPVIRANNEEPNTRCHDVAGTGRERECRLLGSAEYADDRDLGVSIIDCMWEKNEKLERPIILRLDSLGHIKVGRISPDRRSSPLDEATTVIFPGQSFLGKDPSMSTEKRAGESRASFESKVYARSHDFTVEAPIHRLLFHTSQMQYNGTMHIDGDDDVVGMPRDSLDDFLRQLIESSPGLPISAYEAWHMLQWRLVKTSQDKDAKNPSEALSRDFLGLRGFLPERHEGLKRKSRDAKATTREKEENPLSSLLKLKNIVVPSWGNDTTGDQAEGRGQQEAQHVDDGLSPWPLLPPEPFLKAWDSLTHSRQGTILAWQLQCPKIIAKRLSHAQPTKRESNTTQYLHKSIVSMKMLASESTLDQPSSSSALFSTLAERWEQNERSRTLE